MNRKADREAYLDALLSLPRLLFPQVSQDGRWVAWCWLGVGEAIDVFAAPTDGSQPPLRLTDTHENTLLASTLFGGASWTPDGRGVIVAQDHGGNERYQLYMVDLGRPLHMIPLT